jgi:hypothetical protein
MIWDKFVSAELAGMIIYMGIINLKRRSRG